ASFQAAISTAKEQKSVLLEKRAEATYAEYRCQKASGSGGRGFRLPLCYEFLRVANDRIYTPTPVVRGLLDLRLLIGRLFRVRQPTQAAPRTTIAWLFDRILY